MKFLSNWKKFYQKLSGSIEENLIISLKVRERERNQKYQSLFFLKTGQRKYVIVEYLKKTFDFFRNVDTFLQRLLEVEEYRFS